MTQTGGGFGAAAQAVTNSSGKAVLVWLVKGHDDYTGHIEAAVYEPAG